MGTTRCEFLETRHHPSHPLMKLPFLRPSTSPLIACLWVTTWPSLLHAQSAATGCCRAGGGIEPHTAPEQSFDLSLMEPTAKEGCEMLTSIVSTEEDPVNIVIAKDAEAIALPSMKLRKVTLPQFASFLNSPG
jgi:hypothetical protein